MCQTQSFQEIFKENTAKKLFLNVLFFLVVKSGIEPNFQQTQHL